MLIDLLSDSDGVLAERSHRALVKISFNDWAFSTRRWRTWWKTNRKRHRIEWAIDSLNHSKEQIRGSAYGELRRFIGDGIEWPEDWIDYRQRRELQRRAYEWWEREGRALFPIPDIG
jgi:hypothetical protein